ncbi:kinocilin-like isoform X1 [Sphaeramia orbicularis]|uniref:kinocilin-like isoform X1 n=1 Tax=Sphaeramia orbicularis TaxID=375764 RepID=UPI00117D6653|nr:kinocilin-like isoform X1 [Sphaeramia orbicularis]
MNSVSVGHYHGLRVGSSLLSIVAGCIIIGVSRECDADAVGGIFLGAGGLGLLISIFPFIKAWLNINNILPSFGNFRVHPTTANPAPEQPVDALKREGTQSQLNLERSKSRMTFVDGAPMPENNPDEGTSSDMPDVLSRRKFKQSPPDQELP